MSKYNDMRELYEDHIKELKVIHDKNLDIVRKDRNDLREKNREMACEIARLQEKVRICKEVMNHVFDKRGHTDNVFIFEGALYMATHFNFNREHGGADSLTVDFVRLPTEEKE